MKKMCLLMILVLVMLTSATFAGTNVSFWVTLAGSTTPINSFGIGPLGGLMIGGIGSTLFLSVWYSTDVPYTTSVTTLFGWDTATSKGTAAVPLDGKLTGSLATNIQGDSTQWTGPRINALMGGQYNISPTEIRPYGVGTEFTVGAGQAVGPTTAFRLYDVTITNAAIANQDFYSLPGLWYAANTAGFGGACYITGKQTLDGPSINYYPGMIPEPTSILALSGGLAGLIGFALRRRRM